MATATPATNASNLSASVGGQRRRSVGSQANDARPEGVDYAAREGETMLNANSGRITGRITPALGRERDRKADSRKRAPMPARVARSVKRTAGRTAAALTPAHVRSAGSVLDAADKDYVRRKLGRRLGKFAPAIERTSVRVEDVNGPRGGIDKRCMIKVVLSGLPSVVVEERHHSLQAAMDRALARTERAVRRTVQRRRMKSLNP